jgi:hypothetical protein
MLIFENLLLDYLNHKEKKIVLFFLENDFPFSLMFVKKEVLSYTLTFEYLFVGWSLS